MIARRTALFLCLSHLLVGLLLVPGWLVVDVDDAWRMVPDEVPDALLLAIDRGVGAYELPGLGIILMLSWVVAFGSVGLTARSGRPKWLLLASASSAAAGILGLISIVVLLAATLAIGLVLPSDWDAFDPDLRISWPAYGFALGALVNALLGLVVWLRERRIRKRAPSKRLHEDMTVLGVSDTKRQWLQTGARGGR
jgi:amino acid transporter